MFGLERTRVSIKAEGILVASMVGMVHLPFLVLGLGPRLAHLLSSGQSR